MCVGLPSALVRSPGSRIVSSRARAARKPRPSSAPRPTALKLRSGDPHQMEVTFDRVKEELGMVPLPGEEGGLYQQTYIDAHSSAIYYAIGGEHFSALHRL